MFRQSFADIRYYPAMLIAAFVLLCIAVALGLVTAILILGAGKAPALPRILAPIHGLAAIAGFICLLLALGGPPRAAPPGTASFGMVAAGLLVLAVLAGGAILAARLKKKPFSQMLFGIHATLAMGGFVILAAYIFAA